ncbi:MAG: cell division protein FtsK [Gracilibacter sp. BRH_c7a]|nr:MAG: cell division protein FtsK [Gracilibacter sp. BRH_c7a]
MAAKRKTRTRSKKSDRVSNTIKNEILGILIVGLACLGLVLLYSDGASPIAGAAVRLLKVLAGDGSAGIFVVLAALGISLMGRNKKILKLRIAGVVLLWLVLEGFMHLGVTDTYGSVELFEVGKSGQGGGLIGFGIVAFLVNTIGVTGSYILLVVFAIVGSVLVINRSLVGTVRDLFTLTVKAIGAVMRQINDFIKVLAENEKEKKVQNKNKPGVFSSVKKKEPTRVTPEYVFEPELPDIEVSEIPQEESELRGREIIRTEAEPLLERRVEGIAEGSNLPDVSSTKITGTPLSRKTERLVNYRLPPLSLVHKSMKRGQKNNKDLADNVRLLEDTLASFGVKVKVTRVTQGPTITRYELQPAPGVKVSKITNLSDDISLSLAASDVRIEAPIPGKSVVGIEVPNKEIALVHFREVLESEEYQSSQSKLTLALGKDISGSPIMADLTRMPHLLIAGATGSGKSVCINTIIASIVYKAKPDEVKLLLIDPKVVELTNYNGIPHLISPVVVEPQKAAGALKWIVTEMETRYELFAASGVRDIVRYNFIVSERKDNELKPLPYVVVIIDELADLMMVAPGEVEEAICRLAQMARAAGIHLIVATQRPSVDVITGLIKANIPSRIAFAVSSQIDSRTILDMGGAEKLLGRGDMLYHPIGISKPIRVQGCFLADKEVKNIVDYLKVQAKPEYHEIPVANINVVNSEEPNDELFFKAANIFIDNNTASVSLLQRRLKIGYTRAARIMDFLEEKGVVGQYEGSKPREVLMTKGQFEQKFGKVEDL